ncbi:MAG: Crp/Fnr family transcriptional regulator [Candidatus Brocadiales bacterium]
MTFVPDLGLEGAKTITLRQGDVLFYEGSPADEMYYVQSGTMNITKRVLNKSIKLGEVGAGEFISERAVLGEGLPRAATAEAHTDCEVVMIDKKQCRKYGEALPPFVQNMLKRMATRLYQTNEMVVKMARTQEMVKDLVMRMQLLETSMMQSIEHPGPV